jgi:hypothetical protein
MLRQGVSLQDIAGVLRHRSLLATEIYANVDVLTLRQIGAAMAGGEGMLTQDVQAYLAVAPGYGIRDEVVRQSVARVRSVFRCNGTTPCLL